eukprot:CAMPEP_0167766150 /NCGR_PEP_ID=MMETSP0110_2-20121227/15152_1 /TAXON_ID=629695 /ORGANISM="Gymnochlora sp., Strain CCMP2014" /LENGTH=329 /DNA_ID=CAMNT_0007654081 /DNA_START=1654 /DNA_END=2643 /DNA_ORIENTATION=+
MSTIGYGDITPKNEVEQAFGLFAMLCGSVAFAYGLTNLCSILFYFKQYEVDYEASFDQLFEFFERHHVPLSLRLKLQEFLSWKYSLEANEFSGEAKTEQIFEPLTLALKQELLASTANQAFPASNANNEILLFNIMGNDSRFKGIIWENMHARTFAEGDIIHSSLPSLNPIGNSIAFVSKGSVLWHSSTKFTLLEEGSAFNYGFGILGKGPGRQDLSVVAASHCLVFIIKSKKMRQILEDWPFIKKPLENYMKKRAEEKMPDFVASGEEEWYSFYSELVERVAKLKAQSEKAASTLDGKNSMINDQEDCLTPGVERVEIKQDTNEIKSV